MAGQVAGRREERALFVEGFWNENSDLCGSGPLEGKLLYGYLRSEKEDNGLVGEGVSKVRE